MEQPEAPRVVVPPIAVEHPPVLLAVSALESIAALIEQEGDFDAELGTRVAAVGARLVAAGAQRKPRGALGTENLRTLSARESVSFAESDAPSDDGKETPPSRRTSPGRRVSFGAELPSASEPPAALADIVISDEEAEGAPRARAASKKTFFEDGAARPEIQRQQSTLDMSLSFPLSLRSTRTSAKPYLSPQDRVWRSLSPKGSEGMARPALRRARSERGGFELLTSTSSSSRLQSLSFLPPEKAPSVEYAYMLSPLSKWRIAWDVCMVFFLGYVLVMEPFRLGYYADGSSPAVRGIDVVLDTFFLVDLVANFRTGFYDADMDLVMEPRACAANYLRTWFTLDFVSSIPPLLSALAKLGGGGVPGFADYLQVAKLAKFFKVLRVLKFFKMNQDSPVGEMLEELTASKTLQAGFKFFSIIGRTAMLAHLMACFMAASGAGFLETYAPVRDDDDADSWGMMRRYLAGFYWAITTMSTVGYGDVTPASDGERAYAIAAMIIGGGFYGYVVAQAASMVTAADAKSSSYQEKMDQIAAWLTHHQFPTSLKRKIRRYYRAFYKHRTALDEKAIIEDLDPGLQQEIAEGLLESSVRANELVQALPRGTLYKMVSVLRIVSAAKGEVIVEEGATTYSCFIVKKGAVVANTERRGRIACLRAGASFNELAGVGVAHTSDISAEAIVSTELYLMQADAFLDDFDNFPDIIAKLQAQAAEMQKNRLAIWLKVAERQSTIEDTVSPSPQSAKEGRRWSLGSATPRSVLGSLASVTSTAA